MKFLKYLCFLLLVSTVLGCQKDQPAPMLSSVEPTFGPAETLVTFEGANLQNIEEISFSGQSVNFNTAYNSEVALLFRIPTNVPLGEHVVDIKTSGGITSTNFRVTLEAPAVFEVVPEFASSGDIVTILGKNFFEPIKVFFFDSVQAEIISLFPDSMEVRVPQGIQKGRITVDANGGVALSPVNFFSINPILINDFDGNGLRSETNRWIFTGQVNENAITAVQNTNPAPIDGNYLKLTGKDDLGISWIGGAQSHFGFPGDNFTTFGVTTDINNTLLEMDINNNGRKNTHLTLILQEYEGAIGDFVHDIHIDWEGWERISVPLNRFENFEGLVIDPAKIKLIKIHMTDTDSSNSLLEINVDNIRLTEIL
ncbi:MAG: glycan-binding surface protein [Bacteroidota bacterium]